MTDKAIVPVEIRAPSVPTMGEVEVLQAICKAAAMSGFLTSSGKSNDFNGRTADAFFVVMYGRELGIPAMTALRTIYVINGKPTCSGQALLALMRKGGIEVDVPNPSEITEGATVKIRRAGSGWKPYTYTKQMAIEAGLWGKGTWVKSFREMLIWRAVSMGARFECPDIIGGLYTVEEIAPETAVDEAGAPIGDIITIGTTKTVEATEIHWSEDPVKMSEWVSAVAKKVFGSESPDGWRATILQLLDKPNFLDYPNGHDAYRAVEAVAANLPQPTPPDTNGNAPAPVDELEAHFATPAPVEENQAPASIIKIHVPLECLAVGDIYTTAITGLSSPSKEWEILSIGEQETIEASGRPYRAATIKNVGTQEIKDDKILGGNTLTPVIGGGKIEAARKDASLVNKTGVGKYVWVREEKVQS